MLGLVEVIAASGPAQGKFSTSRDEGCEKPQRGQRSRFGRGHTLKAGSRAGGKRDTKMRRTNARLSRGSSNLRLSRLVSVMMPSNLRMGRHAT